MFDSVILACAVGALAWSATLYELPLLLVTAQLVVEAAPSPWFGAYGVAVSSANPTAQLGVVVPVAIIMALWVRQVQTVYILRSGPTTDAARLSRLAA
jgi:hypothetical protein